MNRRSRATDRCASLIRRAAASVSRRAMLVLARATRALRGILETGARGSRSRAGAMRCANAEAGAGGFSKPIIPRATTARRLDERDRRRDDVVMSENRAREGAASASSGSPSSGGAGGVSANDDASTRERETDVERLSRELLCEEIELEERGGDAASSSPAHLEAEAWRLRRMADDLERDAERMNDKVKRSMRQRARELFRIAHERRDESEEMFARARLLRESSRRQSRDHDDDDDGDGDPRKFRFRPA